MSRSVFLRFCSSFRLSSSAEPFFTIDRRDSMSFCCSSIFRLILSSSNLSISSCSFCSLALISWAMASLDFSVSVLSVASLAFSLFISPLYWFSSRALRFSALSPSKSIIAFSASAMSFASSSAAFALALASFRLSSWLSYQLHRHLFHHCHCCWSRFLRLLFQSASHCHHCHCWTFLGICGGRLVYNRLYVLQFAVVDGVVVCFKNVVGHILAVVLQIVPSLF